MQAPASLDKKTSTPAWYKLGFALLVGFSIFLFNLLSNLSRYEDRLKTLEADLKKISLEAQQSVHPTEFADLQIKADKVSSEIQELDRSVNKRLPYGFGLINCTDPGFDTFTLDSPPLTMFVRCEKVEPYLEGFNVFLEIGNPHAVNLTNISGELKYSNGLDGNSVKFSFPQTLPAASWHPIKITIPKASKEQLRTLLLNLTTQSISMWQPSRR